jgi:hypothetical protein
MTKGGRSFDPNQMATRERWGGRENLLEQICGRNLRDQDEQIETIDDTFPIWFQVRDTPKSQLPQIVERPGAIRAGILATGNGGREPFVVVILIHDKTGTRERLTVMRIRRMLACHTENNDVQRFGSRNFR